ncbi:unnamed protein product [Kuraishia capsulata CBS 1993]|uniref:Uncharacterized protein n=1 Tax=Kuraishia capsulata CBS 1993 TaxID=1382522 RepID=W6MR19_9ASCO|nr:uncharacterized protein KUCA_T00003671001 [Kuraishia capsulata CBS 1993]CDK27692.1 unnamed protein product [Kuraishia capsulata CBS 1993]
MSIRPPTHAGSWYSSSRGQLDKQMTRFLDAAPDAIKGARVLIGP